MQENVVQSSESPTPDTRASSKRPAAQYVRHRKRPSWGLAAFVWERDGKRAYRFEDGELRAFKRGFYHLLEPTRPPEDMSAATLMQLGAGEAGENAGGPTLAIQLAQFREEFPEGFAGETWRKKMRGSKKGRRLKRHRDGAIATAAEVLGKERLDHLIVTGAHEQLWSDVLDLLASVDFVKARQVKSLRKLASSPALSHVLRDFLHGTDDESERFEALAEVLGKGNFTWPVVSALRALADPRGEFPVRVSVMKVQAPIVGTRVMGTTRPTARAYREFVAVARQVRDWLEAQAEKPADLVDVHDFIWLTLRPAARKRS